MDQPSSLVVCQQGHMVALFAGDSPRVVASGDLDLYARFEAIKWPERIHVDEAGPFSYRELEPLDLAQFLKE